MQIKEAKDFLVQQAAEQAALERIPFSDLERRMMYFTEDEGAEENPIALNEEFEEKYDDEVYEAKISRLLRNAYKRLKKENPEKVRLWGESIQCLRKGDHYILLLCGDKYHEPQPRPPYDSLKLLGTAFLVVLIGVALMYAFILISDHYGIHGGPGATVHQPMPLWMKDLLLGLMIGGYLYFVIRPMLLKKSQMGIGKFLLRTFWRAPKNKPNA